MSIEPIIIEATSKHTSTLIFLHGLSDTGHGWSTTMASIRPANMKVICPTAPKRSITATGGFVLHAWWDFVCVDFSNPQEDKFGINDASQKIHNIINNEIKNGIPAERIILGGFSQGGALALYSALTFHEKIAGVIALSCWLPLQKQFPAAKINSNEIPIFQTHGDADRVIPYYFGLNSANHLKTFMKNLQFQTYSGLIHSSSNEELIDIKNKLIEWVNSS